MRQKVGIRFTRWHEVASVLKEALSRSDVFPSCVTCSNFDEASEICRFYKQRPPARIIADGCPTYLDVEEIPF